MDRVSEYKRNSSIELLRIVSMFLIVMHHYSVHGGFNLSENGLNSNVFFVQFLSLGGKIGVNLFILITGYFMVNSKVNLKKLVKLEFEVLFYSVGFMLLFYITGLSDFNPLTAFKCCFPTIYGFYGFITSYMAIYIMIPAFNKLIHSIDKATHFKFIIVSVIMWSVIPTFTTSFIDDSPLIWLVVIYFIAAYIRLYPSTITENAGKNVWIAVLSYLFIVISTFVLDLMGFDYSGKATYFMQFQMLPVLICSVSLFVAFKNIKMGYKPVINKIAASCLGVFLIHDNYFVRLFLWHKLLKNGDFLNSPWLLFHAVMSILGVYIICTIIDMIRIYLIEKPLWKYIEPKLDRVGKWFDLKYNKLYKLFD